ncbi:hypothetical protein VIGAN_06194100, partial [Vigna angularis var. angularis]
KAPKEGIRAKHYLNRPLTNHQRSQTFRCNSTPYINSNRVSFPQDFASKKMSGMESEVRVWEREEQNDAVRCCATTSRNNEAGYSL